VCTSAHLDDIDFFREIVFGTVHHADENKAIPEKENYFLIRFSLKNVCTRMKPIDGRVRGRVFSSKPFYDVHIHDFVDIYDVRALVCVARSVPDGR